ncbi:hypothetical protein JCM4814A_02150 [Streptomyces phaeofaciens JCM 4814]|uniref:Uncharacterized protein n=1 Tax=Streptomyces phaeofaciens TaxID=68254 RepID=A0A918M1I4_9ACTN|nr:hypothetical protein GCM10010226_84080 [Streptomyces phaeofaciens]
MRHPHGPRGLGQAPLPNALRAYRMQAADGAKDKGTILNFPEGPGEPGDIAFDTLRESLPGYDLIALDPRGVGRISPLSYATDKILKIPFAPVRPTEAQRSETEPAFVLVDVCHDPGGAERPPGTPTATSGTRRPSR